MILTSESYLLINKIFVILIVGISFWLGFWVYFADKKNKVNQTFFFWVISTSLWIFLYYLLISSKEVSMAVVWAKIGLGTVSLFFIPFYLFFIYYLKLEKKARALNIIILISSIIFFVISIFTNLVVKNVEFKKIGVDIILGRGSLSIYLPAIFLAILVAILLLKNYLKASLQEKLKIQYILVGVLIWALLNSIFNIFPAIFLRKNTPAAPLGNLSFIFLLGFTAYAIVKRQLFGIKVVLTELFVGAIAILLFINFLVSQSTFEYTWKGTLFFTFLVFSWLLIKSVIGEIKQREKLDKLATQLATSNIRLESAYKKLQKLDKAKTEFLSIASHQLRTPLTAIKGYISMILEGSYGKIPEKVERPMENVFKSNERLIKLVNELLNVTRIESGRVKLSKEEASLEEIISNIVEELKVEAENKGLYLKFEKPEISLPKILIDKDKIRQVILNIVDNAIKYTENGGVTIKSEIRNPKSEKESIIIKISDTGAGITKEEIGGLFQSFKRGIAGNKLWTEGTGLGLYVAKKFVEMHQGKIWARSEGKGKGSTFFIELPVR